MENIASLLATTPDAVEKALCFRVVGNKLGAVEKMHTVEQAVYGRDAFAKAIYERLFTWIVGRINAQLEVKVTTPGDNSVIGVLDIYGFEIFENNRYARERESALWVQSRRSGWSNLCFSHDKLNVGTCYVHLVPMICTCTVP